MNKPHKEYEVLSSSILLPSAEMFIVKSPPNSPWRLLRFPSEVVLAVGDLVAPVSGEPRPNATGECEENKSLGWIMEQERGGRLRAFDCYEEHS